MLPSVARYEIAVRCAVAEPRPLQLLLDGQAVAVVCGQSTGGTMLEQQRWFIAGVFSLPQGTNRVALASDGLFPPVSTIRLIRVD